MATECVSSQCVSSQCVTSECVTNEPPVDQCTDGPLVVISTADGVCNDGPVISIFTGVSCTNAIYGVKEGCTLGPYISVTTCGELIKPTLDTGNQIVDYPPAPKKCNSSSYWCDGEHESALLYCDNCIADPQSTVLVNGQSGTDAADAICGNCSDGQLMEFTDTVRIDIILSHERLGNAIVLFGHDLCDTGAVIDVMIDGQAPELKSHSSSPVIIDPLCSHCASDAQCEAIAIYPPDDQKGSMLTLIITAAGLHRIDRLFWGQCCEICLEVGTVDPWAATRYERTSKQSGCVIFPPDVKPRLIDGEFSFQNRPESWIRYTWRSIRDYVDMGYPVWLAISKNRRPNDVGLVIIGDVEGATWDSQCTQSLTVPYRISTHAGLPCHDSQNTDLLASNKSADSLFE